MRGPRWPVLTLGALASGFDTPLDPSGHGKRHLHAGTVTAVAFLSGTLPATGGQDGRIALWNRATAPPGTARHRSIS